MESGINLYHPPNGARVYDLWDDNRDAALVEAFGQFPSASKIATHLNEKFGTNYTKNAVISRLHKLGLSKSGKSKAAAAAKASPRKKRHREIVRRATARDSFSLQKFNDTIPLEQRKTLFQLTNEDCHWPVGDPAKPDFFFCGGPMHSRSYCEFHARIAFRPAEQRVDKRPLWRSR